MNIRHLPLLLAVLAVLVFSCKKDDECVSQATSAHLQRLWQQVIVDPGDRFVFNTYFITLNGVSGFVFLQPGNCADTLCNSVQLDLKPDFTYTLTYSLLPVNTSTHVAGTQSGTYRFNDLCYDADAPGHGGIGVTQGQIIFTPDGAAPYTVWINKEDVKPWQMDGMQLAQGSLVLTLN